MSSMSSYKRGFLDGITAYARALHRRRSDHTTAHQGGNMKRIRNPKREPLKDCPFDGGPARLVESPMLAHMPHYVDCMTCHARTANYRLQSAAVLNWNRRTR